MKVAAVLFLVLATVADAQRYKGKSCAGALQSMANDLNSACCNPTSNCVKGTPTQCTSQCANFFVPFGNACGRFIGRMGGGLAKLRNTCHQTKRHP